jgi:hypothetical protein
MVIDRDPRSPRVELGPDDLPIILVRSMLPQSIAIVPCLERNSGNSGIQRQASRRKLLRSCQRPSQIVHEIEKVGPRRTWVSPGLAQSIVVSCPASIFDTPAARVIHGRTRPDEMVPNVPTSRVPRIPPFDADGSHPCSYERLGSSGTQYRAHRRDILTNFGTFCSSSFGTLHLAATRPSPSCRHCAC